MKREFAMLLGGWLALAAFLFVRGWENLAAPGLYYDEAIFAGLAKDFLAGQTIGHHMPGAEVVQLFGRPFPIFVQPYLGAFKCWLLISAFKIFGPTLAAMRGENLCLGAMALLLGMSWAWRLLGLAEALVAGLLLATDPAFFFGGALDWGSMLPGLLCRLGGFFLALIAWRRQNAMLALAAGVAFGFGIFNKIDSSVVMGGALLAAVYAGGRSIGPVFRTRPAVFLAALLGFLMGAGFSLGSLSAILRTIYLQSGLLNPSEYPEKISTLGAMYDGSYFYRLMAAGGRFDKLHLAAAPVWTPFGIVVFMAALALVVDIGFTRTENPARRAKTFLLVSASLITLGVLVLPGAVRIHHATLVYPLPHVVIAAGVMTAWRRSKENTLWHKTAKGLATGAVMLVVASNCVAVQRTERLIRDTGGRGWWNNALMQFAAENKTRPDVTIASLDWGFNEQLEFLTHGPRLAEPFWLAAFGLKPDLPRDACYIYLVHPPEYSLSPVGTQFMASLAGEGTNAVVQAWRDGQAEVAFYSISFLTKQAH